MSTTPVTILAVDPIITLSKADKDKLRRAGVIVISASPDKVRAIEAAPALPLTSLLRAALETVVQKRPASSGETIRSEFARRVIRDFLGGDIGLSPEDLAR